MIIKNEIRNNGNEYISHRVTGGNGVQLYVEETGNLAGRPLLFIHGGSQCRLCWNKQVQSDLANDFRLVTMDLRGHGYSEKPEGAYSDAQLWADDIYAVIKELNLIKPILIGWSFAGVPILDYIKIYGKQDIGGIHFVGALTRLGKDAAIADLGVDTIKESSGFFSTEPMQRIDTLDRWLKIVHHKEVSPEEHYFFLGYNAIVPSYVHQGIFSREVSNDDLLNSLTKPVLVTHGKHDRAVNLDVGNRTAKLIPHAIYSQYEESGHAVFWDEPDRFNRELKEFALSLG